MMGAGTGVISALANAKSTATAGSAGQVAVSQGKLKEFEGLLKRAGHLVGVVLSEIVRYAIPLAALAGTADPAAAPAADAFAASLKLVQATVIAAQQRWAIAGSAANAQKLADVLETVEQPIITLFAQAGVRVDAAYVTNLVNGVVAVLNAQPAPQIGPIAQA